MPAAYVLLRRRQASGEQVLLQLRRGTGFMDGFWAAGAAGHVESGESVLAAACRETFEELGVTVRPADLIPLCAMHRTHGPASIDQRVDFFFACTRWSGEPRLREADKAADLGWFDLDTLPDPVVPHELSVLEALRGGGPAAIVSYGF